MQTLTSSMATEAAYRLSGHMSLADIILALGDLRMGRVILTMDGHQSYGAFDPDTTLAEAMEMMEA